MRKVIVAGVLALQILLLLMPASPVVRAEEISCSGALGAVRVDNLRVPPNATCTLAGTTVEGNIVVETNATLRAANITVIGNIQAEGATLVEVLTGSTGGSIQVKQGGGATIDNVRVTADIQYEANTSALSATRNQVGGNIQVFQNRGGVTLTGNTVDGNLQCKENQPPPVLSNNTVQGNREDQCTQVIEDLQEDSQRLPLTVQLFLPLVRQ